METSPVSIRSWFQPCPRTWMEIRSCLIKNLVTATLWSRNGAAGPCKCSQAFKPTFRCSQTISFCSTKPLSTANLFPMFGSRKIHALEVDDLIVAGLSDYDRDHWVGTLRRSPWSWRSHARRRHDVVDQVYKSEESRIDYINIMRLGNINKAIIRQPKDISY